MPSKSIILGALGQNHLIIKIFGYEHQNPANPSEANWLSAELDVAAGVWSGRVRHAFVSTAEVREWLGQVERLDKGELAEAHFEPMEPHLVLKLHAEGGKIQVSGVAFDEPEGVNAIAFNWLMEAKQLKTLIKQLKEIGEEWPER